MPQSLGGSTVLYAGHRCIRVETASISTHCLVTNRILCFWPVQQSKKQLPRRRRKKKTMSFLEKWLCWRLASRSSHPQSPAERSVPCLELGWSERALTQPRAAQSLSVSNAGGRRGSLPTSTLCLLQSIRATKMGEREIICGNTASCMMLASLPVSCRARYTKQPPPTGRTPFQGGGAG